MCFELINRELIMRMMVMMTELLRRLQVVTKTSHSSALRLAPSFAVRLAIGVIIVIFGVVVFR